MTTVAVLQPGYLPWLGYFELMQSADIFVLYDDVQFDKHGWRNRNRVKCSQGAQWLTVPVRHHAVGKPRILEIEIDGSQDWARKHVATIRQCYARATHLEPYATELEETLSKPWQLLADLDIAVSSLLAGWLGIRCHVVRSSELDLSGSRIDRLIEICVRLGSDRYRSGMAAQSYLDVEAFRRNGIQVEWQNLSHPVYPQLHGAFVSHLSVLDLILNCGEESATMLAMLGARSA